MSFQQKCVECLCSWYKSEATHDHGSLSANCPFAPQPSNLATYLNIFSFFSKNSSYQELNDQFGEKDRIRVVVRIRPLNDIERSNGDGEIMSCDRTSLIVEGKQQSRKFMFDTVYDPNSTQDEVFNYSGIKRLINMAIDG